MNYTLMENFNKKLYYEKIAIPIIVICIGLHL